MDEIDRNLVVALQENGAAGLAELSKAAGLSVSATAERVKRLEERNVIRGWRIDLDPVAAGCPLLAFVFDVLLFSRPTATHEWIGVAMSLAGIFVAGLKPAPAQGNAATSQT